MAGGEKSGKYRSQSLIQGAIGLSILIWIQVTPSWENDTVWIHDSGEGGGWTEREQVASRGRNMVAVREGRIRFIRIAM